jgi:hypothetical protein
VGAAVAVLSNFDTDRWDADVYGAMALAARLSALVKDRAATLRLAYRLWNLDNILRGFMNQVHNAMESSKSKSEDDITPERIMEVAQTLRRLYNTVDRIYGPAKKAGLTNNSMTAMAFNSIRKHADDILDLAEWFEMCTDPEGVESIFKRAADEEARGEIFDLESI